MKARTPALGLFILLVLVFSDSMAQKATFTSNGGLIIGFGGGMSYQKSDLVNSKGFGFDFILGSQLYQKENAFLALDWKFRFLAGQNKAFDHRINPDDSYSNIRYSFFTYDLELGLTLNRLRERTGIVLTGFAGAGITHGRTFTDLYDAGNNLYDFSSIDPNRDSKSVYGDLVELSDGDFETRLVSKAAFLPTAGIFLGYQLSRSFTIGVEYKTNFYLSEENGFAGIDLDNRALSGSGMDRNNYVSLGFGWKLGRGSSSAYATNYSTGGTNNYSHGTSGSNQVIRVSNGPPSVKITDPSADPFQAESPNHTIRATIENVSDPAMVSFYQNGFPNNSFTYNVNTLSFTANVRLREGENSFRILAGDQASTAEDQVLIVLHPPEPVVSAPGAEFTSPWRSYVSSTTERIELKASVRNIGSRQDIQLTLDGIPVPFEYEPATGSVWTDIQLKEGDNHLLIRGSNESGSAEDQLSVSYNSRVAMALPTVQILNPIVPMEVNNRQFPLSAQTQNVPGRGDVVVVFNGSILRNFAFSDRGAVSASLLLSEGINTIEITAENEAGYASDRTSITYRDPVFYVPVYHEPIVEDPVIHETVHNETGTDVNDPVIIRENTPCPAPVVRLVDPVRDQVSTSRQNYTLRAEVRNVTSRDQLRLMVNGQALSFNYDNNSVSSSVPLNSGLNTISLHARNECGDDRALTRISYSPTIVEDPCTPPTVSFTLSEVNRADATHELSGAVTGVKNKADIRFTLDGGAYKGFQFAPATGRLNARFKLAPGSHTLLVSAENDCGTDSESGSVKVTASIPDEEEACGVRINPGNSDWQFCLVTPSGTFTREHLANKSFSYSGSASSLYFMPTGGGGNATVNGRPYTLRSGQYYLFTGGLKVSVSTSNPGAMGQWSVCITAGRPPASGNGNKRPMSPCEDEKSKGPKADRN